MRRLFRSAFSDNRGSTLIETAVAMLVVIPMLLWLFEMCMYCYTTAVLQYAARQGVEYAMTHGTDAPNCSGPGGSINITCPDAAGSNVTGVVAQMAKSGGHNMTSLTVQSTWAAGNNNPESSVTVMITTPYTPYIHLPFVPSTIKGTATGNIVY